ncbi:zinc finger FYVE domain-containing protein 26 [Coccinella septempunctata]|uniref:zinc finger FYVE domain-containing protein 26 n=1 Tax=Coccinella septempunctata TaxID=41139 RepID=UPI001D08F46B|nr:zinc finger FYVE domain-containing protein 26 [Coccinella septempunctata]
MEESISLIQELDGLISEENEEKFGRLNIYRTIACWRIPQEHEAAIGLLKIVMPKIQLLIDKGTLRKDLISLSILATQNFNLLEKLLKYEKEYFYLNLDQYSSLYKFCIFKKEHWIAAVEKNFRPSSFERRVFSDDISKKLIVLKCLDSTINKFNLNKIVSALKDYEEFHGNDDTLDHLVFELKKFLDIIMFCRGIGNDVDEKEVYNVMCAKNILDTLSIFIPLEKTENWPSITQKLKKYDESYYSTCSDLLKKSEVFKVFTILATVFNIQYIYTTEPHSMNDVLEELKKKLLSIDNSTLVLELLEDIFAILFLTEKHMDESKPDIFKNNEAVIRSILYVVKGAIEELQLKGIYRNSENYERFTSLCRYVHDTLWRLQIVTTVKSKPVRDSEKILCYMLASPMSLLCMCLRQGSFDEAHQVVKIFDMREVDAAKELVFTENLRELRTESRKLCRMQKIQDSSKITTESMENFKGKILKDLNTSIGKKFQQIPESRTCPSDLCHYKLKNEMFMNLVDFMCTESSDLNMSYILSRMVCENNTLCNQITSPYSNFCERLITAAETLIPSKNLTIRDIILSSNIPFDISEYLKGQKFIEDLIILYDEIRGQLVRNEDGIFNSNHSAHKTYNKIDSLCKNFTDVNPNEINYLKRLFNYLKAFSRVLYIEENTSDIISQGKNTSFFELLDYNRSELMGQLLFERNLDPTDFEIYFSRMELDFLYHLIGNCFPTINLHSEEFVEEEELFPENNLYLPTRNIIHYILRRNWLLALILEDMYEVPNVKMNINDTRIKAFLNYRNLDAIQNLKCIFDDNEVSTSLQREIPYRKVKEYIEQKLQCKKYDSTPQFPDPEEMLEAAEELTEESSGKTDWNKILEILQSIPEIQMRKNKEFRDFQDSVVCKYINDHFEEKSFEKIYLIHNKSKRLETILRNLESWPYDFCLDVIKSELNCFTPPNDTVMEQLHTWQQTIELYGVLSEILNLTCWSDCGPIILNDIQGIFKILVESHKVCQILVLIQMHKPPGEILRSINEEFFLAAFEDGYQITVLSKLLEALPLDHSVIICNKLLKMTANLEFLNFIVDFLKQHTQQNNLTMIQLSLKIFTKFSDSQREQFVYLINNPLEIIEVLIMNTKFEELATVLDVIKQYGEEEIFSPKIDEILRIYAEKSLDFHVITQANPQSIYPVDSNLIESETYDSYSRKINLSISQEVTKDQWVKNNEVMECMCCKNVNFSILNRRHHCRQCGRLVCYKCSTKRMKISTCGDILVRVCDDCYNQINLDSTSTERSESTSSKLNLNYMWTLTDDEERNKIVRDEFAYEYTPSVSLCLSILKFHSKTEEYPKFLLNHSNNLLNMFPPFKKFMPDIDYLLIIRMLKSLITVAKMLSQEYSLIHNMSLADSLLNQVDLLELFSERGCLNLLPVSTETFTPSIDASILRRFRDNLLEMEEWNLALEISTKAGLDQTSVFAAWGKKLLKAGCLTKAREKINRCFNSNRRYDSRCDSFSEYDDEVSAKGSNFYLNKSFSDLNEKKPLTNSPLLNEIINILECKSAVIDKNIVDEVSMANLSTSKVLNQCYLIQKDPAVSILNKLRNLDCISSGKYYFPTDRKVQISYATNRPIVDTVFYNECIFYLSRYGSHQSLLDFYIRHGELDQALQYILGNNMGSDIFIEIYMNCLKDGLVNVLQENIAKIDSTLDVWKHYLHQLCRHLEQQNFLHSLYQLQLFMGDFMRAAITCIKFYQENTKTFSDLARKNKFLHKAEEHIKQMHEQDEWVEVTSVGKYNSNSLDVYEEKLLANPSIVMKPNYKNSMTYLNIIWSQNEVASFLADCEAAGRNPINILSTILPDDNDSDSDRSIPTLFGSYMDKIRLAILILVTSNEIKSGFKIVARLISEFKLRPGTVFSQTGKHLAKMQKYEEIKELVACIKTNFTGDKSIGEMCDEMLTVAVATLSKEKSPIAKIEDLIKLISDKASKISAFIEAKQLKTAYFLAVRSKRISDIRRILREAELNNQPNIKTLCLKVLQENNSG